MLVQNFKPSSPNSISDVECWFDEIDMDIIGCLIDDAVSPSCISKSKVRNRSEYGEPTKCGSVYGVNINKSHTLSINFANVLELVSSFFRGPNIPDFGSEIVSKTKITVSLSMDTEADAAQLQRRIGEAILNCLLGQVEWNDVKTLLPFRKSPSEFELTLKALLASNQNQEWK